MKICLDAGHGGHDSGACHSSGRMEKNDVLNYCVNGIGKILSQNGIEVIYTRSSDVFLSLQERCNVANGMGADLFVSGHRDGFNGQAHGAHTCVYEDSGTQHAIASNLAVVYKKYGFTLRANNGISERPELWVLNGTKMNAILLEVGFVDSDLDNGIFDSNFSNLFVDMAKAIVSPYGISINGELLPGEPIAPNVPTVTPPNDEEVDVFYQVRTKRHGWLPPVRNTIGANGNTNEYAGWEDSEITDVAIRATKGSVKYRVHILGGGWLAPVTGFNIKDANNGFAGIGKIIDKIEAYYFTPSGALIRKIKYRVAPVGGDYYSWQYDNEKDKNQDGFAGAQGRSIGKLQMVID